MTQRKVFLQGQEWTGSEQKVEDLLLYYNCNPNSDWTRHQMCLSAQCSLECSQQHLIYCMSIEETELMSTKKFLSGS